MKCTVRHEMTVFQPVTLELVIETREDLEHLFARHCATTAELKESLPSEGAIVRRNNLDLSMVKEGADVTLFHVLTQLRERL